MRKLLIFLLVIQVSILVGAQFEIVTNLEEEKMHMGLYGLDDKLKYDHQGRLGALVIVNCGLEDVLFIETNSLISQHKNQGSYWVVLKDRAKRFLISKVGFANKLYEFPFPLASGKVYKMTIDGPEVHLDKIPVMITCNEDDALVSLNGKLIGRTSKGQLTENLPIGNQIIELSKIGFNAQAKTHNVSMENNIIEFQLSPFSLVFVEGGTFQMGTMLRNRDEQPVHEVTVSDFYISKYEVTQAEWEDVMGTKPAKFQGYNNPVEQISWFDAIEFCNEKSIREGLEPVYLRTKEKIKVSFGKNGYRLPTEAEWEFAARGGNNSLGYIFSGSDNTQDIAWYDKNSNGKTHHVGSKKPNELGIYDMSGNVWEMCWDCYGGYSSESQINPAGPTSGTFKVSRGGSWSQDNTFCRVTYRYGVSYTDVSSSIGLRLVRSSK